MHNIDSLVYWIRERHRIYLKRQSHDPMPWTQDKILQDYRFCNVRRVDDKVSQWLLENWYRKYPNHPNALLACALARFINLPDALSEIGYPKLWRPRCTKEVLYRRMKAGKKIFNGAYMVRSDKGINKVEYVIDRCITPLQSKLNVIDCSSMQSSCLAILGYGIGSFMAGQIVADLRWAMRGSWADKKTWAPIGPGSRRGMNRLYGRNKNAVLSQSRFLKELQEVRKVVENSLPDIAETMEAIDLQSCLCEFDKYERVRMGEGRPKQRYRGAN